MGRLLAFFHRIIEIFRIGRAPRPEDIPKKLSAEALDRAMQEARFLHGHRVDVKPLAPGELPVPRRADENH